jgi:UDP-N-acetylmuramoyl-L-alanyl-D-glutamate--2,6-diaminopimelate ligase
MAEAVQAEADEAWLTTDNPRYENPEDIAEETLAGFDSDFPVTLELERRSAIEKAMSAATRGDIVLIAGKGHESYQDVMGQKRTFSDRQLLAQLQGVK